MGSQPEDASPEGNEVFFKHRITYDQPESFLHYRGTYVPYPWYKSLEEVEQFQARDDDLCIISFPRTGKQWLSGIVWMIRTLGSGKQPQPDTVLNSVVPFLEQVLPPAIDNPELRDISQVNQASSPRLYATHLGVNALPPSVLQKAKVIYVIRNPKDVLVSLYHFKRAIRAIDFKLTLAEFVKEFMKPDGKVFFGPYFDHLAGYWPLRQNGNVLVVFYEDLVKEPHNSVKKIAKFMDVELTDDQLEEIYQQTSFSEMKQNPKMSRLEMQEVLKVLDTKVSPYMRAGKIGSWKETIPDELSHELDAWITENLKRPELEGLTFQYE